MQEQLPRTTPKGWQVNAIANHGTFDLIKVSGRQNLDGPAIYSFEPACSEAVSFRETASCSSLSSVSCA